MITSSFVDCDKLVPLAAPHMIHMLVIISLNASSKHSLRKFEQLDHETILLTGALLAFGEYFLRYRIFDLWLSFEIF